MGFWDTMKDVAVSAYNAAEKKALEVEKEKARLERYSSEELKRMHRSDFSARNMAIRSILEDRGERDSLYPKD